MTIRLDIQTDRYEVTKTVSIEELPNLEEIEMHSNLVIKVLTPKMERWLLANGLGLEQRRERDVFNVARWLEQYPQYKHWEWGTWDLSGEQNEDTNSLRKTSSRVQAMHWTIFALNQRLTAPDEAVKKMLSQCETVEDLMRGLFTNEQALRKHWSNKLSEQTIALDTTFGSESSKRCRTKNYAHSLKVWHPIMKDFQMEIFWAKFLMP